MAFRAVGAGIIWRSPIGPLRFDWAFPLDGKDRDRVFVFNVGAGF
jgi:outer membrane protein assembly factor BamA